MQILNPAHLFLHRLSILKMGHEARQEAGDKSISGLQLLFYISIVVLVACGIAFILGLC